MNDSSSMLDANPLGYSGIRLSLFLAFAFLVVPGMGLAQSSASSAGPSTTPSATSELNTYVKIVGAVITGVATLLGLPIVFLTYRKTRVEITKLELEANALREQQAQRTEQTKDEEGNIRILVDRSPNANVQVSADPRFLAPLLLLLDFIFAWIVLSLAGHLLSIFDTGALSSLAMAVLTAILLLPIARQVLRVRVVLRPPRTPEEVRASLRQVRVTAYAIYAILMLSSMGFGTLLLAIHTITNLGRHLAWILIGWGTVMGVLMPFAKTRFERHLRRMQESDSK